MTQQHPAQHQERQPGREHEMQPQPEVIRDDFRGSAKLGGKVAIVTGGDSGLGRSVAVHFAREGADVMIAYLEEDRDAEESRRLVRDEGVRCELFKGDLGDPERCGVLVEHTLQAFGRLGLHDRTDSPSERRLYRQWPARRSSRL